MPPESRESIYNRIPWAKPDEARHAWAEWMESRPSPLEFNALGIIDDYVKGKDVDLSRIQDSRLAPHPFFAALEPHSPAALETVTPLLRDLVAQEELLQARRLELEEKIMQIAPTEHFEEMEDGGFAPTRYIAALKKQLAQLEALKPEHVTRGEEQPVAITPEVSTARLPQ